MSSTEGPYFLITPEGTFRIRDEHDANDYVAILTALHADLMSEPLLALSRQQVATRLGRGLPSGFPVEDVVTGDPHQGGTRGWWDFTVQRFLGAGLDTGAEETGHEAAADEAGAPEPPLAREPTDDRLWPIKSRQWDDVDLSGVDHRVLIATSFGIVTPSGMVKSGPLNSPARLGEVVCKRRWGTPPGGSAPQVWVTPEALEAVGFPIDDQDESGLPAFVADFFGCAVKYHQSGWFSCEFDSEIYGGDSRNAEIILIPFLMLNPSSARPMDRGVAGIQETASELPDDETEAAHLLGDRIAWLYGMEGTLPASRWSMVGAQLANAKLRNAKPKLVNTTGPAPDLKMSPLPQEITATGKLPSQWWSLEGVEARGATTDDPGGVRRPGARVKKPPHRARGNTVDVEVDQVASYLPSAEGLYLGWGEPDWVEPNPAVFNEARPPFGMFQLTTPAGNDLDGLHRKLPLPHPQMRWDKPTTWWATTADVRQLTAAPEFGGAGISPVELQIDAAWVWPEQHQWLKGFSMTLRSKRIEAIAAGRDDRVEMIKAVYTSFFGRMAAVGDSAWKYPLFKFTQPAWYASIEAVTRARALKYATRIARDFDIYPIGWWADAWFYRVPADFEVSQLEDPLRDGVRTNGSYRIKNVDYPEPPSS